jgi:gluconate 5-dehydrogenase
MYKNTIQNLFSLEKKKIFVTGAAGGLGKKITSLLLVNNAHVIATDISKINLYHKNLIKIEGVNLTNNSDFKKLVTEVKKIKKINGLINFCGITHDKSFQKIVDVNFMHTFDLMKYFSNYIIKNKIKKSSLVNITSLNSELGFSNNPGYVSSKGALKMLTKSFAVDYAKFGIRFNNVGPGYFKTPMTKKKYLNQKERNKRISRIPLGRYGNPEELFGVIVYLLSDASSYVTGQDFYIDGGFLSKGI